MDDQRGKNGAPEAVAAEAPKPKRAPPSRQGKGPTPGSFKPGTSGNPRGRPRTGLAFAERVRERVDPDLVIDLAIKVAEDETLTPRDRLAALWPLIDRGFVKPPTDHRVNVHATSGGAQSFDHLTDAEIEAELERLDRLALPGDAEQAADVKADPGAE